MRTIIYADVVSAARKVAAIMVKGHSYTVDTAGGVTASVRLTEGGHYTISLPSYPAILRLPRTQADYILGMLVHELAHVRFTGFVFPEDNSPILMAMTNALEDCRIEREVIDSHEPPNGAKLLTDVCETLALKAQRVDWGQWDRPTALAYATCILGRLPYAGYEPLPGATRLGQTVPAWAAKIIRDHLPEIMATKSTDECWTLARKMLAAIPKPKDEGETTGDKPGDKPGDKSGKPTDEPGKKGKPRKPDDSEEGEPGEGETGDQEADQGDQEADQGDDQGDQEPQGRDEGDQGDQGDQDGEEGQEGPSPGDQEADQGDQGDQDGGSQSKGGEGGKDEDAPTFDPVTALEKIMETINAVIEDGMDAYLSNNVAHLDSLRHKVATKQAHEHSSPYNAKHLREATPTAGLAPKVRAMLHSQDDSTTTRYETRGRLDRRALARLDTGDPRVFTRRAPTDGIKTGVGLLLDMSSSMGDMSSGMTRTSAQAMAAIALGDACVRGGADVAMWGFGPNASHLGYHETDSKTGVLIPFKAWSDPMDLGASRLAGHHANYGTNLCPSLIAAAQAMAARPALDKRILLVMTDGDCRMGRPMLRATAAFAAAKYGVTIVGVGIQCDVKDAFPAGKSVNVMNIRDLATTTMRELIKVVG